MASVEEQTDSRVGFRTGVSGILSAPRVFRVVIDDPEDNPIETLFDSQDGVAIGQEHPWAVGSGLVVTAVTVTLREHQTAYIVTAEYTLPLIFPGGSWRRRFRGSLQSETAEQAKITIRGDETTIPIGPRWYIPVKEWDALPAMRRPPIDADSFSAIVITDGLPMPTALHRLAGEENRRTKGIDVRRPVCQIVYENSLTTISRGAEKQALDYLNHANLGEFDGFRQDTVLVAEVNIETAQGQLEGQAFTGIVHNITIVFDVDLLTHQPIRQASTLVTDGVESFVLGSGGRPVIDTYFPYVPRLNMNDLLDLFATSRGGGGDRIGTPPGGGR